MNYDSIEVLVIFDKNGRLSYRVEHNCLPSGAVVFGIVRAYLANNPDNPIVAIEQLIWVSDYYEESDIYAALNCSTLVVQEPKVTN